MKISGLLQLLPRQGRTHTSANRAILSSLLALAWVVEARDPYTGGHLWRVSRYSGLLADRAGLSPQQVSRIALAGFLHDIGKIAVPDSVLLKADRLSDEEYSIIKTHPEVGRKLLARHPIGNLVLDAVYSHHERPDGKGYPLGLTGAEIPAMSAIVGICDAFDAMTSARPYRKPMPLERALSIIGENLGTQFDEHFGKIFLTFGETENLRHIAGHSDDGIPLRHCATCGPTIVVRRNSVVNPQVFCPACGTGYQLDGDHNAPVPTGSHANAQDLEPEPDEELISRIIAEAPAFF